MNFITSIDILSAFTGFSFSHNSSFLYVACQLYDIILGNFIAATATLCIIVAKERTKRILETCIETYIIGA